VLHSCSIVTCEPNGLVRPIHDRMPVVLKPELEAAWLDPAAEPGDLMPLLAPPPDDLLVSREVGDFVNDVREDGPHLIEPRQEEPSLF
jgi:putative SOS response-associated peptidase YedK